MAHSQFHESQLSSSRRETEEQRGRAEEAEKNGTRVIAEVNAVKLKLAEAEQRVARLVNHFARFFLLAKKGDLTTLEAEMNAAGERALQPPTPTGSEEDE